MRFARDEIARRAAGMSRRQRGEQRLVLGVVANVIVDNLVHPDVYAAAGLDPDVATKVGRANEHHHAKLRSSAENLTTFLADAGLIGGRSTALWRKARLI